MLPTRLNLLPKEKQLLVTKIFFIQYIKKYLELLLILLCLCGVVIIVGDDILQDYFNDLAAKTSAATTQNTAKNSQIKRINKILTDVETVQKQYYSWSDDIADLTKDMPGGITITALDANKTSKSLILTGRARVRNDLLLLQDVLAGSPLVGSIEVPPSQLTERENIVFSITAKIK